MTEKQITASVHRVLVRRANKRADAKIRHKHKRALSVKRFGEQSAYYTREF